MFNAFCYVPNCGVDFAAEIRHKISPTTGGGDKSREFFISRELADQVIKVLPSNQWKLLFALARVGGLWCPSEVLSLKWKNIDFGAGRNLVTSPKTEHHEGGQSRLIPLFPELRTYLEACRHHKPRPNDWVITEYRKMDSSYGTLLRKRLRAAGIEPWPSKGKTCGRHERQNSSSNSHSTWFARGSVTRKWLRTNTNCR